MEVEVELQGKSRTLSNSMVSPSVENVNNEAIYTSGLLEEVLERNNMLLALKRVISNKGGNGVDGMKTDKLHNHTKRHWETIRAKLLEGKYNFVTVRRKETSKLYNFVRKRNIDELLNEGNEEDKVKRSRKQRIIGVFEKTLIIR